MAAPDTWLEDAFVRLRLLIIEALGENQITEVDVVIQFPYQQNSFPYITLRLLPTVDNDPSEDISREDQRIAIRIVVAHMTDQSPGLSNTLAYRILQILRSYLKRHHTMVIDEFYWPDEDDDWLGQKPRYTSAEYMTVETHTGMSVFPMGGVGNQQVGIDLAVTIHVQQQVY